ncbi:GTPase-activating protein and VPS9 domain-containing protein 1 [Balamuthia mandrillaris]
MSQPNTNTSIHSRPPPKRAPPPLPPLPASISSSSGKPSLAAFPPPFRVSNNKQTATTTITTTTATNAANSNNSNAGRARPRSTEVASTGFVRHRRSSSLELCLTALKEEGGAKEGGGEGKKGPTTSRPSKHKKGGGAGREAAALSLRGFISSAGGAKKSNNKAAPPSSSAATKASSSPSPFFISFSPSSPMSTLPPLSPPPSSSSGAAAVLATSPRTAHLAPNSKLRAATTATTTTAQPQPNHHSSFRFEPIHPRSSYAEEEEGNEARESKKRGSSRRRAKPRNGKLLEELLNVLKKELLWLTHEREELLQKREWVAETMVRTWAESLLRAREAVRRSELFQKSAISLLDAADCSPERSYQLAACRWSASSDGVKKYHRYCQLVRLLKSDSVYVATMLTMKDYTGQELDSLLATVGWSLYGDLFELEARKELLLVARQVAEREFSACVTTSKFLRQNSALSKLITFLSRHLDKNEYLKTVLSEPLRAVIRASEEEGVVLESNPQKIYDQLSPSLKQQVSSSLDGNLDPTTLSQHPIMKPIIHERMGRLAKLCQQFIHSIFQKLPAMPYEMRWMAKTILRLLYQKNPPPSAEDIRAVLGNLVFLRYFNPPIVNPEPYGILSDSDLGEKTKQNLLQIAKVLQNLAGGGSIGDNVVGTPLEDFMRSLDMGEFFEEMVDVEDPAHCLSSIGEEYYGCQQTLVISHNELIKLHSLCNEMSKLPRLNEADGGLMKSVMEELGERPPPLLAPSADNFFLLVFGESVDPEHAILQSFLPIELESETSEVQKKLTAALGHLTLTSCNRNRPILDVLGTELELIQEQTEQEVLATLLAEAMRTLKDLPPELKTKDYSLILKAVKKEHDRRKEYREKLSEEKQRLLLTEQNIKTQIESFMRARETAIDFINSAKLRRFREVFSSQVESFVAQIKHLQKLEDKKGSVREFMKVIETAMQGHNMWKNASTPELRRASADMERYIMRLIYPFTFAPNESDVARDKAFFEHLHSLQSLPPHHPSIAIASDGSEEVPYGLALKELGRLNDSYSPEDKLACIQKTCRLILNLLKLSTSRGVDEAALFFNVLVYTIIQTNPDRLLSNVQYIEAFAKPAQVDGSNALAQFISAINYIKIMQPEATQRPPSSASASTSSSVTPQEEEPTTESSSSIQQSKDRRAQQLRMIRTPSMRMLEEAKVEKQNSRENLLDSPLNLRSPLRSRVLVVRSSSGGRMSFDATDDEEEEAPTLSELLEQTNELPMTYLESNMTQLQSQDIPLLLYEYKQMANLLRTMAQSQEA